VVRSGVSMFTVVLSALLAVACGGSPEEAAVEQSFNRLVDAMEAGNSEEFFRHVSGNTRLFLDDLATGLAGAGAGVFADGGELMEFLLEDELTFRFHRGVASVTVDGDSAVLVTSPDGETHVFLREEGNWRLDMEPVFRNAMDEILRDEGMTLEDLLP